MVSSYFSRHARNDPKVLKATVGVLMYVFLYHNTGKD